MSKSNRNKQLNHLNSDDAEEMNTVGNFKINLEKLNFVGALAPHKGHALVFDVLKDYDGRVTTYELDCEDCNKTLYVITRNEVVENVGKK